MQIKLGLQIRADSATDARQTARDAMFYDTARTTTDCRAIPFKAIVSPRPVGWITSMSAKGEINLAPYSFFNAVSDDPPIVMFSSEGYKDSLTFVAADQGVRLQPRDLRPAPCRGRRPASIFRAA